MPRKIIEKRLVSLAEVKKILEEKAAMLSSEELDLYQQATLDYAQKFTRTSLDEAKQIIEMLKKDYSMPETYAIMVANIIPHSVFELRTIFEKENSLKRLTDDVLQEMIYKIDDIVRK
jgi:DNA-directed RNA polymerase subunit F